MKYLIDRIEGNIAVCEDYSGKRIEIEKSHLPEEAKEGSAILVSENGDISLVDDSERENRIAEKMKNIWK